MYGSCQADVIRDLHYELSDQSFISNIKNKEDLAYVQMYGLIEEYYGTIEEAVKIELENIW
jgi:hypothetical protein